MKQKTLKVFINEFDFNLTRPLCVGEEVMLIEKYNENTNKSWWDLRRCDGIGGNIDSNIKKYHGWRGTTNNIGIYAHGLRKVIRASELMQDSDGDYFQKVTVGKDLKPDEE